MCYKIFTNFPKKLGGGGGTEKTRIFNGYRDKVSRQHYTMMMMMMMIVPLTSEILVHVLGEEEKHFVSGFWGDDCVEIAETHNQPVKVDARRLVTIAPHQTGKVKQQRLETSKTPSFLLRSQYDRNKINQ